MMLYQLDENKVLEYKIMRSHHSMVCYKTKIIEDKVQKFYDIETTSDEVVQKIKMGKTIDSGYYSELNHIFFRLVPDEHFDQPKKQILTDYIHDVKKNPLCVTIENRRPKHYAIDYFLVNSGQNVDRSYYTFSNVWKMPIELASITLLEQGAYERFLEDSRLLEALPKELYQAVPIREYDAKILTTEILGMDYVSQIVESQGKILNKIKK